MRQACGTDGIKFEGCGQNLEQAQEKKTVI